MRALPDLGITPLPARSELRQSLREQVAAMDPPLRVLASELMGATSIVDLLAVDGTGTVVVLLIGEKGEDLELFTRALAQREWVQPRLRDWVQLAPSLQINADARVRVLLLCPSFQEETLLAARGPAGRDVELGLLRWVRNGSHGAALVELMHPANADAPRPASNDASAEPTTFRSGLTEQDLNLSVDECREFK